MKVIFDSNVYISFIRERTHLDELLKRGTVKYLSAVVLMELWAGARSRAAERVVQQLQKPYADAGRIITLKPSTYIAIGQFYADLPKRFAALAKSAGFLNDVQIAFTSLYLGAILHTEDREHFEIIRGQLPDLRIHYLPG